MLVGYQIWARRTRRRLRTARILKFQKREKARKHNYECERMEAESPRKIRREREYNERFLMFLEDLRILDKEAPTAPKPVPKLLTEDELEDLIE